MKEQYIRQVRKLLSVSGRMKKEIVRDLEEAFRSALEHGETEQDVIERLGDPREFVKNMEEQFGVNVEARKKKKRRWMIASFVIAAVLFAAGYISSRSKIGIPQGVIGGSDGPTVIFLATSPKVDLPTLLLLFGAVFLIAALFQVFRYIRKK